MGYPVRQSQTAQPLMFLMVSTSDHISPATGLSPTVTLSKNGGTFASPAGTVTEVGNGWYKVAGNATDTATLGPLKLHATGTGADPCDESFDVVAYDPQATSLGLVLAKTTNITGLNDVAATAIVSGGAITTSGGAVSTVTTVGTLTTYTGNTPQTGDSFARIGVAGAGLTALGDTRIANLDAAVSTRSTYAGGDTSGTTTLLGRLTSGRATLLDNLDAAISTRSTYAGGDTSGTTTLLTRIPGVVVAQTGDAYARIGVAGAGLTAIGDTRLANLDATVSSRLPTASYTAPTTPPTAVAIATAVWTTTSASDFAAASSPGKILATQLGGAFTTTASSVLTAASLVNAPAGEGGGGGGASLAQIQDELDTRYLTTANVRAIAAILCGNVTENATHTASTFFDINDPETPRVTSTNFATERTVTVN